MVSTFDGKACRIGLFGYLRTVHPAIGFALSLVLTCIVQLISPTQAAASTQEQLGLRVTDSIADDRLLGAENAAAFYDGDNRFFYVVGTNNFSNGTVGLSAFSIAADNTITNIQNIPSNDSYLFGEDISVVETSEGHFLLVSSAEDVGAVTFRILADGSLEYVSELRMGMEGIVPPETWHMTAFPAGDEIYVAATSHSPAWIHLFSMAPSGVLTPAGSDVNGPVTTVNRVAGTTIDGTSYLFVLGHNFAYRIDPGAVLTPVPYPDAEDSYQLGVVRSVAISSVGDRRFLHAAAMYPWGHFTTVEILPDARFSLVERFDDPLHDSTPLVQEMTTASIDGRNFLYVSTSDGRVIAYEIGEDGRRTEIASFSDDDTLTINSSQALAAASNGQEGFLVATGNNLEAGVSLFTLDNAGLPTYQSRLLDEEAGALGQVEDVATLDINGNAFAFAISRYEHRVSSFAISSNGELQPVNSVDDTADTRFENPETIDAVTVDGNPIVLVGSEDDRGVTSFAVSPAGELTRIGHAALPASKFEIVELFGNTFVYAVSSDDDAIHVFRLDENGFFDHRQTVSDDNNLRLRSASRVGVANFGTSAILLASGERDGGTSLFTIAEDGTLTFQQNYNHHSGFPVGAGGPVDIVAFGDMRFLITAHGSAISVFTINAAGDLTFLSTFYQELFDNGIDRYVDGISDIDHIEVDGRTLLLIGGTNSFGLYEMSADGTVTQQSIALSIGDIALTGLRSTGIAPILVDGAFHAIVSSHHAENLTLFETVTGSASVVSITRADPVEELTNSNVLIFDVEFDGPVYRFDFRDIEVTGQGWPTVSGTGSRYQVRVANYLLDRFNGVVGINIDPDNDVVGTNFLPVSTDTPPVNETYTVDNYVEPVESITPSRTIVDAQNTSLYWEVVFPEPVTNVSLDDFDTNFNEFLETSNVSLTTISPTVYRYNATFRSTRNVYQIARLGILENTDIMDYAGNGNGINGYLDEADAISQTVVEVDTIPPATAWVYNSDLEPDAFQVAVVFDEEIDRYSLSADEILIQNGSLHSFTDSNEQGFILNIIPAQQGLVTIQMADGAVEDHVGNPSLPLGSLGIVYDADVVGVGVRHFGANGGFVESTPAGVYCGLDCLEYYQPGQSVSLTAEDTSLALFEGWIGGPCTGSLDPVCQFGLSADTIVDVQYSPRARIVAAVLPGARSSHVGGPDITAFLSVIATRTAAVQNCQVSAPDDAPGNLTYRLLDSEGQPTGPDNPAFSLDAGGVASFVLALSPTRATPADGYLFYPSVTCDNASLDSVEGINSLQLTISDTAGPDVIAIGATPTGDGMLNIPAGRAAAFGVAAINIGAGDGSTANPDEATITATVDTGSNTALPVRADLCPTDAVTGACLAPRAESQTIILTPGVSQTFSVFVRDQSSGGIPRDPANSRLFVRFSDANDVVRSVTSVAITAPSAENPVIGSSSLDGRWSVLVRTIDEGEAGLNRGTLFVANGAAILDDGVRPRALRLDDINAAAEAITGAGFLNGVITADNAVRVGTPFSYRQGSFWGVRDTRLAHAADRQGHAGRYGEIELSGTGRLHGRVNGCQVFGEFGNLAITTVFLSGCNVAGEYQATLDVPANDNGIPALIIANRTHGWRLTATAE